MNESLFVYLNLDVEKWGQNAVLIRRIDELLLTAGMKYSGTFNMYVPVDRQKRDQAVFQAETLLRDTDWLKGILDYTMVGTRVNVCPIAEIQTDRMAEPSLEKLGYYEQYYQKTGKLPHAVIVDENRQLRDGYISYLLAQKYRVPAEVCEMVSGQPLRKIVKGGADKSYGIQVAKLAGVPDLVINRAKEIVEELSEEDITNRVSEIAVKDKISKKKPKAKKYDEVDIAQMSLFDTVKDDDVLEELKNLDVGNMTPIDALNTIYRLQNKLKNRW